MKILRILSSGFEEGGVENGIVLMQPILRKEGHEVRIMASDRRMDMSRFDDYTFKAVTSSIIGRYFYRLFNPNSFILLKKVLQEYKPDVVHLHTMMEVSPSVLFLLKNIPTVLTIHGPEEFTPSLLLWHLPRTDFKNETHRREDITLIGKIHYYYFRYLSGFVYHFALRNVDAFITLSRYMQQQVAKDGIESYCISNATELFEATPLPDNEKIVYSGRLEKPKGADYLIKAMPEILDKRPNARLVIIGDGSCRKDLEKLSNELGVDKQVKFCGHLSRQMVKKVYENSAMLVLPSIWPEAFGKVGIEAMSVGRPVIASDVGGISEWLIDGETGYLVPPENSYAIAEKVKKLLSDRDLLMKMSFRARERAKEFDIETQAKKITALYESVIKKYKKE